MSGEREGPLASLREAAISYEAQFEEAKQNWDRNCRGVDEVLERLRRKYKGELVWWREDTPSRVVSWSEAGVKYSISMMLGEKGKHPPLTVCSTVWQDDETSLTTTNVQLPEILIDTPVKVRDFGTRVKGLVRTLHQQSSLLSQSPLPDSVRVIPLSPRRS